MLALLRNLKEYGALFTIINAVALVFLKDTPEYPIVVLYSVLLLIHLIIPWPHRDWEVNGNTQAERLQRLLSSVFACIAVVLFMMPLFLIAGARLASDLPDLMTRRAEEVLRNAHPPKELKGQHLPVTGKSFSDADLERVYISRVVLKKTAAGARALDVASPATFADPPIQKLQASVRIVPNNAVLRQVILPLTTSIQTVIWAVFALSIVAIVGVLMAEMFASIAVVDVRR